MQRLTAANHVTSMHWSPQADPLPGRPLAWAERV